MNANSSTTPAAYTVFFSHRLKDKHVAHSIKQLLQRHTANVDYFVSEDIEKGVNWRKTITAQLHHSRFLILLFTDPEEDWSWCLYETGFFDALTQLSDNTNTRRIHCLHHPDTGPPKPIADLQTVPATPEEIIKWLTGLFDQTQQTKTSHRDNIQIPQLASEISGFFTNDHKPLYSPKSVVVEVDRDLLDSPDDLPPNTTIQGDDAIMSELFGAHTGTLDWTSVKNRFDTFPNSSEANLNALKEISRAVYSISHNARVRPLQSIMFVEDGPKRYRPVISHAREFSMGRIGCEILLIEETGGPLQNVDKKLGALLTAIRLAVRIRWEIVRPFVLVSNIKLLARLNARKLRFDLQTCFNNIFIEAEFRGNFSPVDVWSAFENNGDRDKVQAMMEEWPAVYRNIWRSIGFLAVDETFSDVSAQPFTADDIASLSVAMEKLGEMNRDFLEIAMERAKVLVDGELSVNATNVVQLETGGRRPPETRAGVPEKHDAAYLENKVADPRYGSYAANNYSDYIGTYFAFRRALTDQTNFLRTIFQISWSERKRCLEFFEEQRYLSSAGRPVDFSQQGDIYINNDVGLLHLVTSDRGAIRVITLSKLRRSDSILEGIVLTQLRHSRYYSPAVSPIYLQKAEEVENRSEVSSLIGPIAPTHELYPTVAGYIAEVEREVAYFPPDSSTRST
jgi:hypothetical protein